MSEGDCDDARAPSGGGDPTTIHVRRALAGDPKSLDWIVRRFSPLLRAHAHHRLGPNLRFRIEPDDVVAEAWLVTLPRLGEFTGDVGRVTPRLLSFLSRTVLNRINDHLKRCLSRGELQSDRIPQPISPDLDAHAAGNCDVVTAVLRTERSTLLERELENLTEADRAVVLLRGVEGLRNDEAAREIGEAPNTVSHRYRRALEKLRKALPDSILDELPGD